MRRGLILTGSVLALALWGCDGKSGTEPTSEEYTLSVVLGEGITGSPSATGVYRAGEPVTYAYAAAGGYTNAGLVLDGEPASLSGTLIMNRDHAIVVAAQKVPVVPAADMPAVQAAERAIQAPQRANYEAYLAQIGALYERYSADEAYKRGQAVVERTFGLAEVNALRAVQEALRGQIFEIGMTPAGSSAISRVLPNTATPGIDVIFVNGMINSEDEAALAALELRRALGEADIFLPLRVRLFYNASALKKAGLKEYCLIQSLNAFFDPSALLVKFAGCFGKALGSDVAEAVGQAAALLGYFDPGAAKEAKFLADTIRAARAAGRSVILVGHSQGTLMATEALNVLAAPDRCVVAVSLGGPLGEKTWGLTDRELAGFTVEGKRVHDLLLELGLNFFPRVETDVSRNADQVVANIEQTAGVNSVVANLVWLQQALRLHKFLASYLPGIESRKLIQEITRRHVETLQGTIECNPTSGPTSAVYGVDAGWSSYLWRVDLSSKGTDKRIGVINRTGVPDRYNDPFIEELAIDEEGLLWGYGFSALVLLDPANGQIIWSQTLFGMPRVSGLTVDILPNSPTRGLFYALSADARLLLVADPFTGNWATVGSTGVSVGAAGDLAFGPDGKLYATYWTAVGNTWWIGVLETSTGRIVSNKALNRVLSPNGTTRPENDVEGLRFVGNDLYGFVTKGGWGLIKINPTTGQTTFVRQLSFESNGAG